MQYRNDINGLRAIAVIAVVIFHFNPNWITGGFAGVDIFFVISGFLMTAIILNGIESDKFSLLEFYLARANRIIPALAFLCILLLIMGWMFFSPTDFELLAKHIASSVSFISNIVYWTESGYFDAISHEKWLLHTWSLSTEWQFYILYPLIIVIMRKFMTINGIKVSIAIATFLGFIASIFLTYKWPDAAYYLLPTRAWEMLMGGVAYIYPIHFKNETKRKLEFIGVVFIISSFLFIDNTIKWPGALAFFPVIGTYLIILAYRNNSLLTNNVISQKIGSWSYSIYLYHWPIVVAFYFFSISESYIFIGILLSIFLGYLSYTFIEKLKFTKKFKYLYQYLLAKPNLAVFSILFTSISIFSLHGEPAYSAKKLLPVTEHIKVSPYRDICHNSKDNYKKPSEACEYFYKDITWAVIGDSHAVEIAYAMAERLKPYDQGLKHFSYSGCIPSYNKASSFTPCANWTNDAVAEIIQNKNINNVIINYRFTSILFGKQLATYPLLPQVDMDETKRRQEIMDAFDRMVLELSHTKKRVLIYKPIPELGRGITSLMSLQYLRTKDIFTTLGTTKDYYLLRNEYVINHFENANYPKNVTIIDPSEVFCNQSNCYAIKNGEPLYFDDNHPSLIGAKLLVNQINDIN